MLLLLAPREGDRERCNNRNNSTTEEYFFCLLFHCCVIFDRLSFSDDGVTNFSLLFFSLRTRSILAMVFRWRWCVPLYVCTHAHGTLCRRYKCTSAAVVVLVVVYVPPSSWRRRHDRLGTTPPPSSSPQPRPALKRLAAVNGSGWCADCVLRYPIIVTIFVCTTSFMYSVIFPARPLMDSTGRFACVCCPDVEGWTLSFCVFFFSLGEGHGFCCYLTILNFFFLL